MSANPNLERQIGELSGILKSLVPALERLESRMNLAETTAAGNAVEVQHMIKQFVSFRDHMSRIIEEFKKDAADENGRQNLELKGLSKELSVVSGAIEGVEAQLAVIQKRSDGIWKKVWDVGKIVAAAALGALAAKYLK